MKNIFGKTNLVKISIAAVTFGAILAVPAAAFASGSITSVTLNGVTYTGAAASAISVTPGATINVTTTASINGSDWESTGWRIATSTGSYTCVDTSDHTGNATYTNSFTITAPSTAAAYNAYFAIYGANLGSDNNCSTSGFGGQVASLTQPNAVTVAAASIPPLVILPSTIPNGTVGVVYSQVFTASTTATGTTAWSLASGSLPAGLAFSTSTNTLSGTPTAAATSTFSIKAVNGSSSSTQSYTVNIAPAAAASITITPSTLPDGTVSTTYGQVLTASTTTTGPFTWTITPGSLPAGLLLGTSTTNTVSISGTPTTAGISNFSVNVTNGSASTTQAYSITVGIPVSTGGGNAFGGPGCSVVDPSNLIPNGNLQQTSTIAGVPNCWQSSGFGTSTVVWSYPLVGPNGTTDKAVGLTVSNFVSGDSNWVAQNAPVQPNTTYVFTDWYNSTSTTEIDLQYTVSTGTQPAATFVASLGATTGWASTTQQITTPANATSVSIYHLLVGNGSLMTSNYSLLPLGSSTADIFPQGLVSITFDDGWQSQADNALPVLNAAGMHASFYIISGELTAQGIADGYMSQSTVLSLQTSGHEIGDHTVNHCSLLTGLCPDGTPTGGALGSADPLSANQEIGNARTALLAAGATPVDTLAYPYGDGSGNPTVEADLAANGIIGARSVAAGFNFKVTPAYELKTQSVDTTVSTSTIHGWIDYAAANKVWLTLMFHQIELSSSTLVSANEPEGTTKAVLQDTVNYLATKQGTGAGQVKIDTVHNILAAYFQPASAVTISPTSTAVGAIGAAYSQVFTAADTNASDTFTWSASGTIPGLSFSTTTHTLSGTPTATGTYPFSVTAASVSNPSASSTASYTVTINGAPVLTLGDLSNGAATVGVPYTGTITATSTNPADTFTFTISSGTLPAWMTATSSAATLTLSGTPPTDAGSTFDITVTGSNTASASTTRTYTIVVNLAGISLSGTVPTTATVSAPMPASTLTVSSTDPGPFTWLVTGLPAGLTSTSTVNTLTISGTPTTVAPATTVSVTATSQTNASTTVTQTYQLEIISAPTLSVVTTTPATAFVGTSYSATVVVSSTNPADAYTWTVGGTPSWMTVNGTTTNTLTLGGTPDATSTANILISVAGANVSSTPVSANYTLVTHNPSHVLFSEMGGALNNGRVGDVYAPAVITVSDPVIGDTFVITQTGGALPAGLTLGTTPTTFTISGTPTTAQTSTFDITATSNSDPDQVLTQTYLITIDPPLPTSTLNVTVNVVGGPHTASDFTVTATGGHVTPSSTPGNASGTAISIDAGTSYTATISNFPNYDMLTSGNCNGTMPAAGLSTDCAFTETWNGLIVPFSLDHATEFVNYGPVALTASTSFTEPLTWSISSGALPGGMALDTTATGSVSSITGIPNEAGTFNFTVMIADASSSTSTTQAYTLIVDAAAPAQQQSSGGGGGGGGGGGSGYYATSSFPGTGTGGQVLGASTSIADLLNSLLLQLQALEKQLVTKQIKEASCTFQFNADMQKGSTGTDVMHLQQVLNMSGLTQVASSGAGSPGNETTYFGNMTKKAVSTFQGIFSNEITLAGGDTAGNVGQGTRTVLNGLCSQ